MAQDDHGCYPRRGRHLLVALLSLGLGNSALAQQPSRSPLPPRLGADARASIERVIDSARVAGLPTEPLTDKALEGALKGADDQRIVAAVQSLVRELGAARTLLGGVADATLLGATASALHAGVPATDLSRLIRTSGSEVARPPAVLATALIVIVDLVSRRVPVSVATSMIGDLLQHGAQERQFTALRNGVEQDISAGRTPESAMLERTRAQLRMQP